MKLEEYIEKAKQELDSLKEMWRENNEKHPNDWPLEMDEGEWGEQELASRFQITP